MEQPAPSDGLPPDPAGRCPRCRVHTCSQNSPVASGLIKSTFYYLFPSGASLSLGNKVGPAGISFLVRLLVRKAGFRGAPDSPNPDLHPFAASQKHFPLISDRGQHFLFCHSQRETLLGLRITAAQNKEKQIEMRFVITVKGMRGCVSVSMVNAIFQRRILPAVKTRFMLGVGKSKP